MHDFFFVGRANEIEQKNDPRNKKVVRTRQ